MGKTLRAIGVIILSSDQSKKWLLGVQNHMRRKKVHHLPLANPDVHAEATKVCSLP